MSDNVLHLGKAVETDLALQKALVKALGAMEAPTKDRKADRYRYADLAAVFEVAKPALAANGLALIQHWTMDGERKEVCVITSILHADGGTMSGPEARMPVAQWTAQGIGSALTYCRRYSALAMLGLAPEDDDGAAAVGRSSAPVVSRQPPPTPPTQRPVAAPSGADTLESVLTAIHAAKDTAEVMRAGKRASALTGEDRATALEAYQTKAKEVRQS